MSEPRLIIVNGHACTIGGVRLEAVIDSVNSAYWIEQRGEPMNGDGPATIAAAVALAARFGRVRPDLVFIPAPVPFPEAEDEVAT